MLTRRAEAYSSSCSQTVSLSAISSRLLWGYLSLMPLCAGFLEPRKSRFGLSKSTFNAKILYAACPCLSQLVSAQFALEMCLGGNWEPVYDFLLVISSNLGPISHRYWDTATYWLKITNFFHPLILYLRSGWPPSNLWKSFMVSETRVFQAADGEDLVILACTVFDWSTCVTDKQTDRQNCDG